MIKIYLAPSTQNYLVVSENKGWFISYSLDTYLPEVCSWWPIDHDDFKDITLLYEIQEWDEILPILKMEQLIDD